jgi:hypothetical protein
MLSPVSSTGNIQVRPLRANELGEADQVMRIAFGTFLGLPEPLSFMGDAAYVRPRWHQDPSAAFAAEVDGRLAGTNFAANWGSVGFFGPLSIRPDLWDRKIGQKLMEPVLDCFSRWGTRHAGLFTFSQSAKHVSLYQKYDFWPRFLTMIMSKEVSAGATGPTFSLLSNLPPQDRASVIQDCRHLTHSIYDGLDLSREIDSVANQNLGDTVLILEGSHVAAFAVCHTGKGSEGGSGSCYIKFAAARPGVSAEESFEQLLLACEEFARGRSASIVTAGMNASRHEAYRQMARSGFRAFLHGIAMQRANDVGYNRPGVFVIDDWR